MRVVCFARIRNVIFYHLIHIEFFIVRLHFYAVLEETTCYVVFRKNLLLYYSSSRKTTASLFFFLSPSFQRDFLLAGNIVEELFIRSYTKYKINIFMKFYKNRRCSSIRYSSENVILSKKSPFEYLIKTTRDRKFLCNSKTLNLPSTITNCYTPLFIYLTNNTYHHHHPVIIHPRKTQCESISRSLVFQTSPYNNAS